MKTATELLAHLATGELTATAAVTAHLALLREVDRRTGAVIAFDDDGAIREAERLDREFAASGVVGPLHGLPITVKDWIDVEGFPCAGASGNYDRRPSADATVVNRLRGAGAVVLAKTRPAGSGPAVRHPLDSGRTPGGSSGGEAVVVATGASPLGIGSDSGGSIRLPAAWCGVFGLKPTAGLVPTTGHFPRVGALSDGRTQIGPLARSIDDIDLALRTMAGPDWRDGGVAPVPLRPSLPEAVSGRSFAVVTEQGPWSAEASTVQTVEEVARQLEGAGMKRTDWREPWFGPALEITQQYWNRHELTGEEVDLHLEEWDRFRNAYLQQSVGIDLLLTPAAAGVAPRSRKLSANDYVFTLPASLTGSPALVAPAGRDGERMPLAVQIVGRPWEDHRVLAAGRVVEAMQPKPRPAEPGIGKAAR